MRVFRKVQMMPFLLLITFYQGDLSTATPMK